MAQRSLLTWIIIIVVAVALGWFLLGVVGWVVELLAGVIGFLITLAIVAVIVYFVIKMLMGEK
jgi:hypothetical protein